MLRRPVTLSLLLLSAPAAAQAVWVERAARPFARSMAAAAWDPVRGRMVVFGGSNNSQLGDTWEWDGIRWRERHPSVTPDGAAGS